MQLKKHAKSAKKIDEQTILLTENEGIKSSADRQESEKVKRMGYAPIPKLLAEFAFPAIFGMLVNGAYNLIDSIFLGQGAGEIGLSTITVATPIMTLYIALALLVGNGGNAVAALRLGAGKHDEAELALGNTFFLAIFVAGIMAFLAFSPAVEVLLSISSATEEVRPYARTFIQIISGGYIFQMVGMSLNNFIRTAGAPNKALATMVIGAVFCTIFNYLFVLVFHWGIVGSAFATILGQAISCATVVWYFIGKTKSPLRLHIVSMKPQLNMIKCILSLGAASFVVEAGFALINFATNYLLVVWGAQSAIGAAGALASIGVVQRITMFTILPLIGLSVAMQPLLGFNYGACLYNRVRSTLRYGIISGIAMGTGFWLIVHIWPVEIVSTFGITDESLRNFTIFALKVQLFALPLIGYQIVCSNYFQATGQPMMSIILSLSREVIFLFPLLFGLPYILPSILPEFSGLDAIYFAAPLADALSIVVTALFIKREMNRIKHLEENKQNPAFGVE